MNITEMRRRAGGSIEYDLKLGTVLPRHGPIIGSDVAQWIPATPEDESRMERDERTHNFYKNTKLGQLLTKIGFGRKYTTGFRQGISHFYFQQE
ncbi:MAG: hypothetical protein JSV39_03060 [Candidatus Aenigmatarchaeota archaeon]|nr:MAG: hypothetical protein JSV39_03060 [Candidatus Aenigmarchaeota archaeon]